MAEEFFLPPSSLADGDCSPVTSRPRRPTTTSCRGGHAGTEITASTAAAAAPPPLALTGVATRMDVGCGADDLVNDDFEADPYTSQLALQAALRRSVEESSHSHCPPHDGFWSDGYHHQKQQQDGGDDELVRQRMAGAGEVGMGSKFTDDGGGVSDFAAAAYREAQQQRQQQQQQDGGALSDFAAAAYREAAHRRASAGGASASAAAAAGGHLLHPKNDVGESFRTASPITMPPPLPRPLYPSAATVGTSIGADGFTALTPPPLLLSRQQQQSQTGGALHVAGTGHEDETPTSSYAYDLAERIRLQQAEALEQAREAFKRSPPPPPPAPTSRPPADAAKKPSSPPPPSHAQRQRDAATSSISFSGKATEDDDTDDDDRDDPLLDDLKMPSRLLGTGPSSGTLGNASFGSIGLTMTGSLDRDYSCGSTADALLGLDDDDALDLVRGLSGVSIADAVVAAAEPPTTQMTSRTKRTSSKVTRSTSQAEAAAAIALHTHERVHGYSPGSADGFLSADAISIGPAGYGSSAVASSSSSRGGGAVGVPVIPDPTTLLGLRVPSAGPVRKRVKKFGADECDDDDDEEEDEDNEDDDDEEPPRSEEEPSRSPPSAAAAAAPIALASIDPIEISTDARHDRDLPSQPWAPRLDPILGIDAGAHAHAHSSVVGVPHDGGGRADSADDPATAVSIEPLLAAILSPPSSPAPASVSPDDRADRDDDRRGGCDRGATDPAGLTLLSHPDDAATLSALVCFTRQQIEVFTATPDDVAARSRRGGIKEPIALGRVGIRCRHCAHIPYMDRAKGAISYPKSIDGVHQAVRNWQRYHLEACGSMPEDAKDRYRAMKTARHHSGSASRDYWIRSCLRMGMVDARPGPGILLVDRGGGAGAGAGADVRAAGDGGVGGDTTATGVQPAPAPSAGGTCIFAAAAVHPSPAALGPSASTFAAAAGGMPMSASAVGTASTGFPLYPNIGVPSVSADEATAVDGGAWRRGKGKTPLGCDRVPLPHRNEDTRPERPLLQPLPHAATHRARIR